MHHLQAHDSIKHLWYVTFGLLFYFIFCYLIIRYVMLYVICYMLYVICYMLYVMFCFALLCFI